MVPISKKHRIQKPSEQAVLFLKPGATQYQGRLESFLILNGYRILKKKRVLVDRLMLRRLYPGCDEAIQRKHGDNGRQKINEFEQFFETETITALLVEGPDAIRFLNSRKMRLRSRFGLARPGDGVHVSDSLEETEYQKSVIAFD
jgi:nucleoside diphosphate kinase